MTELIFAHCHWHSDRSPDGLGTISRSLQAAKSLGFSNMAITDHGSLANSIAFAVNAKYVGIKSIQGLEAYVLRDGKRFHLTLLANGARGFKTLVDLNNIGVRGDDIKPSFSLDLLRKHNDGLIVLSGCPASPLQELEWTDARQIAMELKSYLGGRFFAELMFASNGGSWERSKRLMTDCGLKPILTNDAHFAYAGDADSHKIISQVRQGFQYESDKLFLATPTELEERVKRMAPSFLELARSGMRNAYTLTQKLETVVFDATPKLPHIPNADFELTSQTMSSLTRLTSGMSESDAAAYLARAQDELAVIIDMGFSSYFLILADIIQFAKTHRVRVGPGRGSGAGSLVVYLLGITELDPIVYGLSFDRFLNRKRKEMPDIDSDFSTEGRDAVLTYAKDRWGAMPVATYLRYSTKSLVHDISRILHIARELDAKAADGGEDSDDFKQLCVDIPGFKRTYDAALGQIKTIGQHPAGVVIASSDTPIPLERTSSGEVVIGWTEGEHRELSTAGLTKFDLLGLTALSVLRRLEERHGRRADDPVDDSPVFDLFAKGDLLGIFQFAGSQGIRDFTVKVGPRSLEDLVAINALYRPGALDSGAAEMYPEWRKKPRLLHPLIDDILASTFGVICYQEQFMAIFARLTGGDMADADLARKVLSKARPGQPDWELKMAELKLKFVEGSTKQGLDEDTASTIWSEIITHTRYSFNRSHSVAYARVAWDMAWWKYNHRTDFFAALLTVDRAEWERYLFDVVASGVEVVAPHVNTSTEDFVSKDGKLYLPLTVVKNLGGVGIKAIIDAQPFKDTADFMARVPKRSVTGRARLGLWQLGAMDGLNPTADELGVDDPGPLSKSEREEKYMGLYLPDADFLKRLDRAKRGGFVAGIVISKERRKSSYGEYDVFKLMPDGAFWSRSHGWLQEGMSVKCKVRKDNGKLISVDDL